MLKIEEDKELSPRSKKLLKEKARIKELFKKLDVVIKQKEVHDKVTPRESQSVFSYSQASLDQNRNVRNSLA